MTNGKRKMENRFERGFGIYTPPDITDSESHGEQSNMTRKRMISYIVATIAAMLFFTAMASAQTKLLRFADIYGDKVVFTYGGDLWIASIAGGASTATATRLTAHPGVEVFAKFSPDGKWIAFTGQYDGDEQVYVIPVTGG